MQEPKGDMQGERFMGKPGHTGVGDGRADTGAEKQEANNGFIPALPGVPDRKHSARFPGWAAGWAPRHVRSSRIS